MIGTQEARGGRIKDERLAGESFHTGQDLSPFGHPCWAGITNLEVKKDVHGPQQHTLLLSCLCNLTAKRERVASQMGRGAKEHGNRSYTISTFRIR